MSDETLHVWTCAHVDYVVASNRDAAIATLLELYDVYDLEDFLYCYGQDVEQVSDDLEICRDYENARNAPEWLEIGARVVGECTVSATAREWADHCPNGFVIVSGCE